MNTMAKREEILKAAGLDEEPDLVRVADLAPGSLAVVDTEILLLDDGGEWRYLGNGYTYKDAGDTGSSGTRCTPLVAGLTSAQRRHIRSDVKDTLERVRVAASWCKPSIDELYVDAGRARPPGRTCQNLAPNMLAVDDDGDLLGIRDGRWSYLFHGSPRELSDFHTMTRRGYALVENVPDSAWPEIFAEPHNRRRVRLAKRAADVAKRGPTTPDEPTVWTGGRVAKWMDTPPGSYSEYKGHPLIRWRTSRPDGQSDFSHGGPKWTTPMENYAGQTGSDPIVVGLSDKQCDLLAAANKDDKAALKALAFSFVRVTPDKPTAWTRGPIPFVEFPPGGVGRLGAGSPVIWWRTAAGDGRVFCHTDGKRTYKPSQGSSNGLVTPVVVGLSDVQCDELAELAELSTEAMLNQAEAWAGGSDAQLKLATLRELEVGLYGKSPHMEAERAEMRRLLSLKVGSTELTTSLRRLGIEESVVRTYGGGARSDLSAELTGWPGGEGRTAGRGGKPIVDCSVVERVARLLEATRERRMLVHLHRHRGVVRRLATWAGRPVPSVGDVWRMGAADLVAFLGIGSPMLSTIIPYGNGTRVGLGTFSFTASYDTARLVGELLRTTSSGLWAARPAGFGGGGVPPSEWLTDSAGCAKLEISRTADAVRRLVRDALGARDNQVWARGILTSEGCNAQAPMGLRTVQVGLGASVIVEVSSAVPLGHGIETTLVAAVGLGAGESHVDAVYVAHVDAPGWRWIALTRPGEGAPRGGPPPGP